MGQLEYYIKAWLPARDIIRQSLEKRMEIDPSGAVVRLDKVCGEVRVATISPQILHFNTAPQR